MMHFFILLSYLIFIGGLTFVEVTSQKSLLNGEITIPASKSHTIRAVIIGALANGESVIEAPLDSLDTR